VISVLLLDVDGVLRHWDERHFASSARALGLEPAQLAGLAFEERLLADVMTGVVSDEEWADEIGRRAAESHGVDPVACAATFAGLRYDIDEAMVELVREVRRQVRVALFSNASTRLEADLAACALDAEVDVVVSSARVGLAKPDPEAFRRAAALVGVEPSECLFVDDRLENVEGARSIGMRAEVFAGVDELRAILRDAAVLA
jgi:putative hydrolase of the HAD superfamily